MPPSDSDQPDGSSRGLLDGLLTHAADQVRQFVWIFLYLWVLFALFVMNEIVVLNQHGMTVAMHGFAVINAFILAKVMLVVEDLDLGRWLQEKPRIYPIIFEAFLIAAMFLAFHVIERMAMGVIHGKPLRDSVPSIGGGGFLGTVCVALVLFVSLIPFFAFKHLSRAIGPGRVKAILLGTPSMDR
jgi:hypothetical protein